MSDITKKRRIIIAAVIAVVIAALCITAAVIFSRTDKLVVSEICAVNDGEHPETSLRDKDGKLCDWIELYNPTGHTVCLNSFTITRGNKTSAISTGDIPPKGYAIVYCTKNGFDDESVPYADLKIPKTEICTITLKCGSDIIDTLTVSPTAKGMTTCAGEDGAYITTPTPLAENEAPVYASQVIFSEESGFYKEPFSLELSADNSAGIYYTLDGTDPRTSDTAEIYSSELKIKDRRNDKNVLSAYDPMKIQLDYREGKVSAPLDTDVDKGTVIRACAKSSKGEWGLVSAATYFVGFDTSDHSDMPVISLITSPDALYDHETGIYTRGKVYEEFYPTDPDHLYNGSIPANYNQKGREWERECTLQFFESDGTLQFTQDAGMRIQGGWSRADYQKSFRFFARSEYGKDSFEQEFWKGLKTYDGKDCDSFSTFVLRNGGNDSNFLKYKDIMMQDMASILLPATQTGRACVLFIDGEYWGHYVLQEDYSQEYFSKHYGVSEDSVAIIKNNELDEGLSVDELSYNNMLSEITTKDMSLPENYARACELIDIDCLIDYCAFETYIYNDDWPQNNYGFWRSSDGSEYGDGKWRFFVFDTESCAAHYGLNRAEINYFDYLDEQTFVPFTRLIYSLLENEDFRTKYNTRVADMGNILFTPKRVEEYTERYNSEYLSEMPAYYKRFPVQRTMEGSVEPVLFRMETFFNTRRDRILSELSEKYGLGSPMTVKVTAEKDLTVNGISADKRFSGKYLSGSKLALTSQGAVSWSVTANGKTQTFDGDTVEITVTADTEIRPLYS